LEKLAFSRPSGVGLADLPCEPCCTGRTHSNGTEVPPGNGRTVRGLFSQHELVTFESWGASNQDWPAGSGIPFLGQSIIYVASLSGDGDAYIKSSAGSGNYTGFDSLQANFSQPARAVSLEIHSNVAGYYLELYHENVRAPARILDVTPEDGLFLGLVIGENEQPITALRIVPKEDLSKRHHTNIWGMSRMKFSIR
jgi:hypothetical protein